MKNLKMSMMLILTVAFFISCEKETVTELDAQNLKLEVLSENIEVGYGVGSLGEVSNKQKLNTSNKLLTQQIEGFSFFYDEDLFNDADCDNFGVEGFENIIPFQEFGARFDGPLNSSTNNQYFTPGSIVSGLEFSSTSYYGNYTKLAIFDVNSFFVHPSKALTSNSWEGIVIITIKSNHITSIGMDLFSVNSSSAGVDIYDNFGYLINSSIVDFYNGKAFLGLISKSPMSKIVLTPRGGSFSAVAIDNISYGACGDDYDNDGVLNEQDRFPTSNTIENINIADIHLNIDNVYVKYGATMMDQIDSLISEINAQYNGDNYAYLHKRFMTELAQITYYWRKDRLISATERSKISSAAWSAEIPYFNQSN